MRLIQPVQRDRHHRIRRNAPAGTINIGSKRGTMSATAKVTAELIAITLKEANPGLRVAFHKDSCVGVWNEQLGCFQGFYTKSILGQWVDVSKTGLPLANGERVPPDHEWVEILSRPQS